MGGSVALPRINEVAAFLDRYAPATKAALSDRGYGALVEPGVEGGEGDTPQEDLRPALLLRRDVLSTALGDAVAHADAATERIARQLGMVRRVRFAASALAAFAASTILPAIFLGRTLTIIAGVIALAANLAGLAADKLILRNGQDEPALVETAVALRRAAAEARLTARLLQAFAQPGVPVSELGAAISDGNRLFGDLMDALAKAPLEE